MGVSWKCFNESVLVSATTNFSGEKYEISLQELLLIFFKAMSNPFICLLCFCRSVEGSEPFANTWKSRFVVRLLDK